MHQNNQTLERENLIDADHQLGMRSMGERGQDDP